MNAEAITVFAMVSLVAIAIMTAYEWHGYRKRVRRMVFRNLDSAYENGYFAEGEYMHGACANSIAEDMRAFSEDAYDHRPAALVPHVRAWLYQKGLQ